MFGHAPSYADFLAPVNDQIEPFADTVQQTVGFSLSTGSPRVNNTDYLVPNPYFNETFEKLGARIIEVLQAPLPNSSVLPKEKKCLDRLRGKKYHKLVKRRNKRRKGGDIKIEKSIQSHKNAKRIDLKSLDDSRLPIISKPIFGFIRHET